jgi:diguanylate cyclase (GGDEF)-like protein/PAS domain S-box-containing protein
VNEIASNNSDKHLLDEVVALDHKIEDLFELSSLGAYKVSEDGICLRINSQALKWIGCSRESIIGRKSPASPIASTNWQILKNSQHPASNEESEERIFALTDKEGQQRFFHFLNSLSPSDKQSMREQSIIFELSDHRRQAERQRISSIVFESKMGICVTDTNGIVIEANTAFSKITGYSAQELRKKVFDFSALLPGNTVLKSKVLKSLANKGEWEGEIREQRKDGSSFTAWVNISEVPMKHNAQSYFVLCVYDITANKSSQEEIHNLAYFDPLTQLPNRRKLNETLSKILSTTPRPKSHGAALFIDLNKFKSLNDTRGHSVGDMLLIEVGHRLQHTIRIGDTVARVGGDEFVVLLEDLSEDLSKATHEANKIGTKILKSLARPYKLGDIQFSCGASIGINIFGYDDLVLDVIQQADMAMYEAKKNGRNSLCFYDPAMKASATAHANLEQELGVALELDQLAIFFQPQFNSKDEISSAEILLRWKHPSRGILKPNEFISVAEESGLIVPIGLWVIKEACKQIRRWAPDPLLSKIKLAVNVSARQFQDSGFVKKIFQIVQTSGIDGSMLILELTESMMHDINQVREKMEKIRELGILFSLDDFGTGYSSLSSLIQLPINQLKIDQMFVKNMVADSGDAIVVKTIIAMAKSLGINVIAEGLETQQARTLLHGMGCSLYQGHLFSQALPTQDFEYFVKHRV